MNNSSTQGKNKEYYGNQKRSFAKKYPLSPRRNLYYENFIKILAKYLNKGEKVCEIGCGNGYFTEMIQRQVSYNVVGVELIAEFLTEARSLGRNFTMIEADAMDLPFAKDEYKAVVYLGTLHHLPNLTLALEEAYRVLKPGGFCFLFEPNAYSASKAIRMMLHPKLLFKYLKIFKEKDLKERDKKILENREQRSLVPKIVISGLKQANFNIISYKTKWFTRGILSELKLNFLLKNKFIIRIVFYLDNYLLNYISIINKLGPTMVIVAQKIRQ